MCKKLSSGRRLSVQRRASSAILRISVITAFALLHSRAALARSDIELGDGPALTLSLGNTPLIQDELFNNIPLEGGELVSFEPSDSMYTAGTVLRGGIPGTVDFYREIASSDKKVEISWFIKLASQRYGSPPRDYAEMDSFDYACRIPLESVKGLSFRWAGRGWRCAPGKINESAFDDEIQEGDFYARNISYLTIEGLPQGNVTFDFNPAGTHNMELPWFGVRTGWSLRRSGQWVELLLPIGNQLWGDIVDFKMVITAGGWDYENTHSQNRSSYVNLSPTRVYLFGEKKPSRKSTAIPASTDKYLAEKGYGWSEESNPQSLVFKDAPSPFYSVCVSPEQLKPHRFRIDTKPGVYLVHIAFADDGASEPFDLAVNGVQKWRSMKAAKNRRVAAKTTWCEARDGFVEIDINGPRWLLAGVALTPLVYSEEDYYFTRDWWVSQKTFDDWVRELDPPEELEPIEFETPEKPILDWAWSGGIETLEGAIDRSRRAALDTPLAISDRVTEIVSAGYKLAVVNGLHFRFGMLDSRDYRILLRNTRRAVQEARKHNLKLISHHDLNWVMGDYRGWLELLDNDPDLLPRSFMNPFVVQANFCLNSPLTLETFAGILGEHLALTGIDGYMIDEVTFYLDNFCACDRCRELFYEDTGMELPFSTADKQGVFFRDSSHPVWRTWVQWKAERNAAFSGALKARLRAINPALIWSGYSSSSLAAIPGLGLNEHMPWHLDHLGDEFHPDDILHNWRPAFERFRNRQGVASAWGNNPTWYLAKVAPEPTQTQMLFAWAIARMNRGNLWRRGEDYELMAKLHGWKDQMDDKNARPLSDVAVLLSQDTVNGQSRRHFPFERYQHEHGAWIQTLTAANIPCDVIIDRDLHSARIDDYRVLILADCVAMSDSAADAIKAFAKRGGHVIVINETGRYTPDYQLRKAPVFADILNIQEIVPYEGTGHLTGENDWRDWESKKTSAVQCRIKVNASGECDIPAYFHSEEGSKSPAIVTTKYGLGKLVYIAGNYLSRNREPRVASVQSSTVLAFKGALYTTEADSAIDRMATRIVRELIGEKYRTRGVNIPPGVVYTAYRQEGEKGPAILLHLLNLSGRPKLEPGDKIVRISPIPCPTPVSDIKINVKSSLPLNKGFLAAPLHGNRIPLVIERNDEGVASVNIPAAALENYAVVWLSE